MTKKRILLAALIFSGSGFANAGVPVIKVPESQVVEENSYSLLALNNYFFGIKDNGQPSATRAGHGMRELQSMPVVDTEFGAVSGILRKVRHVSSLAGGQVSARSFSFYAGQPSTFLSSSSSSSSPSAYLAPDSGTGFRGAELRYGTMVASPPLLKSWAVLLLVLGCLVYQGRQGRRQTRPFGFRKLN